MLSVLLPVYNEQGNISAVFKQLYQTFPPPHEIIIINDGSTDNTFSEIKNLPCRIINVSINTGKGNAIRLGVAAAQGEYLGLIDGDGQDDPQDLLRLFQEAQKSQADLVIGSRFLNKQKLAQNAVLPINYFGNIALTALFNFLFRAKLSDSCASLRVFKTARVKKMEIRSCRYEIELEMLIRAVRSKYEIKELSVFRFARKHGKSNLYEVPLGRIRFGLRALAIMSKGFLFWS